MSGWPQVRLGDLIVEAAYGTSVKCSDSAEGIPVLRTGNVRYDGTLDLSDLKYASLTDAEQAKFGIQEGDIPSNRTNSKELVGKTGLPLPLQTAFVAQAQRIEATARSLAKAEAIAAALSAKVFG